MRIVLDTNVYIAAALSGYGFSEDILKIAVRANLAIIISEEILLEIERKLIDKFNWSQADIDTFLFRIRKITGVVSITQKLFVVTRDPDDNKILECAVSGEAELIVTLDQDLIKLKRFRGIGIVHPKTLGWVLPEYFKKRKT